MPEAYVKQATAKTRMRLAKAGGAAKLRLLPVKIALVVGYNARDVREIDRIVSAHQREFLENWNAFCRQAD